MQVLDVRQGSKEDSDQEIEKNLKLKHHQAAKSLERELFEREVEDMNAERNGPALKASYPEEQVREMRKSGGQITTEFASGSSTGIAKRMKIMNKNPFQKKSPEEILMNFNSNECSLPARKHPVLQADANLVHRMNDGGTSPSVSKTNLLGNVASMNTLAASAQNMARQDNSVKKDSTYALTPQVGYSQQLLPLNKQLVQVPQSKLSTRVSQENPLTQSCPSSMRAQSIKTDAPIFKVDILPVKANYVASILP